MAGPTKREPRGDVGEFFSRLDHMPDEWMRALPR